MSLDIGGKLEWPGVLEIHATARHLSVKEKKHIERHASAAKHTVVAMQLDDDDNVTAYLYNGSWVTPKSKLSYLDAANAIISHKGLSLQVPEFFTMIVKSHD